MKKARTRQLFANGQSKHSALWGLTHIQPRDNPRADLLNKTSGIYALLYQIKLPNSRYLYWWYVGKSEDISRRLMEHNTQITSPNPPPTSKTHYIPAQEIYRNENGNYCCVALAQWDLTEMKDISQKLLRCSEQVFQCALHSMSDAVLALPQSVGAYLARGQDFSVATFLSNLTCSIESKVSWAIDKEIKGLNFSMAMAETARSESPLWLRHDLLNPQRELTMSSFSRRPTPVIESKHKTKGPDGSIHRTVCILPHGTEFIAQGQRRIVRSLFNGTIPKEWEIPKGTVVNVIVEIMPQGTDHHTPYFRLPEIGAFAIYKHLIRMGIRIEWQMNGIWKTGYLQSHTLFKTPKPQSNPKKRSLYLGYPESPYLTSNFLRALELFTALLQVQYLPSPPAWMLKPASLALKQVVYNHLEQRHFPTSSYSAPRAPFEIASGESQSIG